MRPRPRAICLHSPLSGPRQEPDLPFLQRARPPSAPGPSPVLFLLSVLFCFPLLQLAPPPFIKTALKCSQEVEDNCLRISLLSPTLWAVICMSTFFILTPGSPGVSHLSHQAASKFTHTGAHVIKHSLAAFSLRYKM